jgi:site-specific recombinase XerD
MPRTKTALCPVEALEAHLKNSSISEGAIFLSHSKRRLGGEMVALIVKKAVKLIGKDPKTYAGHSTRRGFVTTAFENGAPIESVKEISRHVGVEMLLRYKEASMLFDNPAQRAVWGMG